MSKEVKRGRGLGVVLPSIFVLQIGLLILSKRLKLFESGRGQGYVTSWKLNKYQYWLMPCWRAVWRVIFVIRVIFSVQFEGRKVDKKQTHTKAEAHKLYSGVYWIFLPNFIKIYRYNFEIYRFKVGVFLDTVLLNLIFLFWSCVATG